MPQTYKARRSRARSNGKCRIHVILIIIPTIASIIMGRMAVLWAFAEWIALKQEKWYSDAQAVMARSTNPRKFLSEAEVAAINSAIKAAERHTSAEVKLVIVRHCWGDLKAKARRVFKELGLEGTEQRNGVLVLLVTTNREFLIYGDQGIHERVGQGLWDDIRNAMFEAFRKDHFGDGISQGIRLVGERLSQYFPHRRDDIDELSNEIVYRN